MSRLWEPTETAVPRYFADTRLAGVIARLAPLGFDRARATRAFRAVNRLGIEGYEALAGMIPRPLIQRLAETVPLDPVASVRKLPSEDGAVKYLFRLKRGDEVEAVAMPAGKRTTLCISSQVGCAMGCTFCATGTMGFRRHLSPAEMIAQVLTLLRDSGGTRGRSDRVNVVFMGMGEPLHNLEAVLETHAILTDREGLVLSERDVSVSTSGLVPQIERLGREPDRPQLMVSIAATTDAARSAIMPVNRAWPLSRLIDCLVRYPLRKRERILLGYVVIAGQNDSPGDAARLAALSQRFPSLVNLIPMNAHEDAPDMHAPDEVALQRFYRSLMDHGAFATIRRSRGRDVAGACGQLVRRTLSV